MNFDEAEFDHPDGTTRRLSAIEFKGLPTVEKVQWIGQGRFRFFRAGERIRPTEALKVAR